MTGNLDGNWSFHFEHHVFFCFHSCGVECHRACCHYNEIKVFEERDHMLCVQEKWMCRHCCFFLACLFIPPTCISELSFLACSEYSWGFNELNWRDCWRLRFAVKPHFTSGGMIHDIVVLPQDQDVDVS